MKSILVIANFASIHVYNFIKNIIDNEKYNITGLTMSSNNSIPLEYYTFYQQNNVKIIEENTSLNDSNITKIRKIYYQLKVLGPFDILHIHYVKHLYSPGIYLLRNNFKKIILTFWGSDFYRSTYFSRLCIFPILRVANIITFITVNMKSDFLNKSFFYHSLQDKICVMDYGNMIFPYIDKTIKEMNEGLFSPYDIFNLSREKITITIGYVGRPQMQQKEAVESITKKLSTSLVDKIQIVIPAYGMDENSLIYIRKSLSDKFFKSCIISEFLGPEKVAQLRSLTDIFVHPQTTDAFSSSMQECFYANAVIINGSWLQYKDVEDAGAFFLKFNSFSQLPELLESVINNIELYKQKSSVNRKIMLNMCSWEKWRRKWRELYL